MAYLHTSVFALGALGLGCWPHSPLSVQQPGMDCAGKGGIGAFHYMVSEGLVVYDIPKKRRARLRTITTFISTPLYFLQEQLVMFSDDKAH